MSLENKPSFSTLLRHFESLLKKKVMTDLSWLILVKIQPPRGYSFSRILGDISYVDREGQPYVSNKFQLCPDFCKFIPQHDEISMNL